VSAGKRLAMSPLAVTKALRWVENQLATDANSDVYRWIFLLKDLTYLRLKAKGSAGDRGRLKTSPATLSIIRSP
jgi:hypothetical protein